MIALFSVWFFSPLTFYRYWNVTEQISLYISSTFAWNKFILRKPHETKIRFHNLFPLKSLHSFRFAYFCFNVTPSGYSHFYPGFLNRIPVRLAFRGGGTSLTAHTHTNKLWIPPKYTHKYMVCIFHPLSSPLLLRVWYFLGYFNHASYEIPTDSSISGSLHVSVAMDNDIFSVPFFYFIGPIFPLDFLVARNHANFEDTSAYTDGLVGGLGGRIFCCEDRFWSCFVWKDTSTHTHTHTIKTNLSWTTWVTAWCLLEMLSAVYSWFCVGPARYLVQSSLLPATTTTRRIPLSLLTFLRARKVWENKPTRVLEKTGQEKKKLENHHGAASGRFRCWSNFGGPRRKLVTGRRSGRRRHETLKMSLGYPSGNVASNLSDKGSANAT